MGARGRNRTGILSTKADCPIPVGSHRAPPVAGPPTRFHGNPASRFGLSIVLRPGECHSVAPAFKTCLAEVTGSTRFAERRSPSSNWRQRLHGRRRDEAHGLVRYQRRRSADMIDPQNGKAIPRNCNPIPPCDNPVSLMGNFIRSGAKDPQDNTCPQSQKAYRQPPKTQDFPGKCTAMLFRIPPAARLTP